jgi:ABC-type transport system involved in multi-copper enzyme maturation permease subunit
MSPAAPSSAPSPNRAAGLGVVPRSWVQAVLMSRYQLRDYLRSRRFILMLAIVAAIAAIISAVLAHFRPAGLIDSSTAFFGTFWAGGVGVLIVFSGIIFGGDAIAGEFQNKTGYFLMGLPIKRWSVYAGKFVAAYAASVVTIVVYLVLLVAIGSFYFGAGIPGLALFESLLLALLYLAALLGTTFLFSSAFKTSLYAVLVVAVMFLFGFSIVNALLEMLANIEPWFIVTYASQVIPYPITGTPVHTGRLFAGMFVPSLLEGIEIMLGYFVVTTGGGLVLFEREEFT